VSAASWPVDIDPVFGCWRWRGDIGNNKRPIIWRGKFPSSAYRVVYERERSKVPDERVLDHLCRRPDCVAPHHLEPVTKEENERRKSWRYRVRIARCPGGHELAANAAMTPEGGRTCRLCNRGALE
jgi:hypothetical protein